MSDLLFVTIIRDKTMSLISSMMDPLQIKTNKRYAGSSNWTVKVCNIFPLSRKAYFTS